MMMFSSFTADITEFVLRWIQNVSPKQTTFAALMERILRWKFMTLKYARKLVTRATAALPLTGSKTLQSRAGSWRPPKPHPQLTRPAKSFTTNVNQIANMNLMTNHYSYMN